MTKETFQQKFNRVMKGKDYGAIRHVAARLTKSQLSQLSEGTLHGLASKIGATRKPLGRWFESNCRSQQVL